jgi:hypothetical protein
MENQRRCKLQEAPSNGCDLRNDDFILRFAAFANCTLREKFAANCIGLIMQNQGQFKHQILQPECCLRLNLRNHQRNYASSKNPRTGVAPHWTHFLVAWIDPFVALRQFRMMKKNCRA